MSWLCIIFGIHNYGDVKEQHGLMWRTCEFCGHNEEAL